MRTLYLLFALLLLASCSSQPTSLLHPVDPGPEPEKVSLESLVEGNSKFAIYLFKQLRDAKGNLIISPFSVSSGLAMAYGGARGETAAEMKKVLGYPEDVGPAFRRLTWELLAPAVHQKSYQLNLAASLWGQKGYPWNPDFLEATERHSQAGLQEVDFADGTEAARQAVNRWIGERTGGLIKDLLAADALTPDIRLLLVTAVHFKGQWLHAFEKSNTREGRFRLDAENSDAPLMMYQANEFRHATDEDVQVLWMPYKSSPLDLVVILPEKVDGLADIEKALTVEKLRQWDQAARVKQVHLTIPSFRMESTSELNSALERLGMKAAFVPGRADFTGMSERANLVLGGIIHRAFVEVNEEGTVAAAATVAHAKDHARPAPGAVVFTADHPFLFLIRDRKNGTILFLGRISRP